MRKGNNIVIFGLLFVIIAISYISQKNQSLPEALYEIPDFSYISQNGSIFTSNHLKDKVSVVDFFFTSCQGPCPAMNRYMKYLVESYSNETNLQFISFSVDPANDSRNVINEYINSGYLAYDNWYFLETDSNSISNLLENGFKLSGDGLPGMHSTKFILVDSDGNITGYYDPFLKNELSSLQDHISYLLESI